MDKYFDGQPADRISGWNRIQNYKEFTSLYQNLEISLGAGNFGAVKLCYHRNTGVLCAVKIISKSYLEQEGEENQENMRQELITL